MTTLEILSAPELYRQAAILFCSSALGYVVGALIVCVAMLLVKKFKSRRSRILDMETFSAARARFMRERETAGLSLVPATVTVHIAADMRDFQEIVSRLKRTMRSHILAAKREAWRIKRRAWLESLPEKARRVLA